MNSERLYLETYLQWEDRPSEVGYYWHTDYHKGRWSEPEVVEVMTVDYRDGTRFYAIGYEESLVATSTSHLWAGPIVRPDLPEKPPPRADAK